MSSSNTQEYVNTLIHGLQKRGIDFVLSDAALGCQLTEVYITKAQELILFPPRKTDLTTLQWILEIRTPLNVRLTFFSTDVSTFKTQLIQAISAVQNNGLIIPNIDHAISIQELSEQNIRRLLAALDSSASVDARGKSHPLPESTTHPNQERKSSHEIKKQDLRSHLRNAIKSYWTERYFARYLNTPRENIGKIAERVGLQQEICGHETLYFFERPKALRKYFAHIIKGILTELNLQYRETLTHEFYILDLRLGLHFFDGEINQLRVLASEYSNSHELIIVIPKSHEIECESLRELFFEVLPLDHEKIKSTLTKAVQQRIQHIAAHSSGIR